jgi:hypothetical protein
VANGSGWYLKKGRSALIEISFQPYKSQFVVALLYIRFSQNESDFLYFLFIKTKPEQGSGKYLIGEDSCLTTSFNEGRHRVASKTAKYVDEAIKYKKKSKKPIWIKWGAIAACLCLVVAGIAVSQIPNVFPDHGAGIDPGRTHPDGIDPVIASIAVYPATESIEDVANATVESIAEADAYGFDTLGEYLPASLPDGYHFEKADLYETTMKDGTVYYMLRVQYTTGYDTPQGNSGEEAAPDPNTPGNSLVVLLSIFLMATSILGFLPIQQLPTIFL